MTEGIPVKRRAGQPVRRRKDPLLAELVRAAEELLDTVRGCEGRPNGELRRFTDDIRKLIRKIRS